MVSNRTGKVAVKPADISSELARVWREGADLHTQLQLAKSGDAPAHVQVRLANIVILVSGANAEAERKVVDDLVSQLCLSHPSRFFVVQYNPEAKNEERILTAVSSRCALSHSGANICSEEVYVTIGEKGVSAFPNLLLSLLVPDVEVLTVIPLGLGLEVDNANEGYKRLLESVRTMSDTLIYHSLYFPDYYRGLKGLFGDTLENDGVFEQVRDVNWERTRRWRFGVAEQFGAARADDMAQEISSLNFEYGGGKSDVLAVPADVFVVAGWIAECLKWKPLRATKLPNHGGAEIVAENSNGKEVKVLIRRNSENREYVSDKQSRMYGLEILMENGLTTSFTRTNDWCLAVCTSSPAAQKNGTATVRRIPFISESLSELVSREVVTSDQDQDFVRTLGLSLKMSELIAKLG